MEEKSDQSSNREQLRREIESLADDQVAEVLEYVSIMRTMREQEEDPLSFKDEIRILLAEPKAEKPETEPSRQPHDAPAPTGSKRSPHAG